MPDAFECTVCFEGYSSDNFDKHPITVPGCGHTFCRECVTRLTQGEQAPICPGCRVRFGRHVSNLSKSFAMLAAMEAAEAEAVNVAAMEAAAEGVAEEAADVLRDTVEAAEQAAALAAVNAAETTRAAVAAAAAAAVSTCDLTAAMAAIPPIKLGWHVSVVVCCENMQKWRQDWTCLISVLGLFARM